MRSGDSAQPFRSVPSASPRRRLFQRYRAGLFGRSSSYAENLGKFVVPEARQVDVNGFLTIAGFEINVGVRNVFNRRNYGTTTVSDFVPVDEPRNVRLTVTKQVF